MLIKHLIVTRYNLHLSFQKSFIKLTRDEKWHKRRLELFEKIYLKCALHDRQNKIEEEYLIFLDFNKEKLDKYDHHRVISPINTIPPNSSGMQMNIEKIILENLKKYDLVISTRLDSDDGLAPNYTDKLVDYIIKEKINNNLCLYFDKFIQYNLELNQMSLRSEKNPNVLSFLSFKNKDNEILNPAKFNHAIVDRYIKTEKIQLSEPMFVQSIHEINVGNQYLYKEYNGKKFDFLISNGI